MLLAANAFAGKGESDEQHDGEEPPDEPGKQQQAQAWALVREEQRRLAREVDAQNVFYLWPEHELALHLFRAVETQYRYVDGLPTGLDYAGVRASPAFRAIARDRREGVFADVCAMEQAWVSERLRLHREEMSLRKNKGFDGG